MTNNQDPANCESIYLSTVQPHLLLPPLVTHILAVLLVAADVHIHGSTESGPESMGEEEEKWPPQWFYEAVRTLKESGRN